MIARLEVIAGLSSCSADRAVAERDHVSFELISACRADWIALGRSSCCPASHQAPGLHRRRAACQQCARGSPSGGACRGATTNGVLVGRFGLRWTASPNGPVAAPFWPTCFLPPCSLCATVSVLRSWRADTGQKRLFSRKR